MSVDGCDKMVYQLIIQILFAVGGMSITVDDCPLAIKRNEYLKVHGDKCYTFDINAKKTFKDAREMCEREGGMLALVKNNDINEFIKNSLNENYDVHSSPVWIGLELNFDDYDFRWMDDTALGYQNFKNKPKFYSNNECVAMEPNDGKWMVYICNSVYEFEVEKHHFVCEYPSTTYCPSNLARDERLNIHADKCYQFEKDNQKHFEDAEKYCKQQGGNIVNIENGEKDISLSKILINKNVDNITPLWVKVNFEMNGLDCSNVSNPKTYHCIETEAKNGIWEITKCLNTDVCPFICEFPILSGPDTTMTTSTIPSTTSPSYQESCPNINENAAPKFATLHDKCYYFNTQDPVEFDEGEEFCNKYGGTLAMLKTKEINEFVEDNLLNDSNGTQTSAAWIGLHYNDSLSDYSWLDGTPMTFRNFGLDETGHGVHVAITNLIGIWYSIIDEEHHFICEFNRNDISATTPKNVLKSTPSTFSTNKQCVTIPCELNCLMDGYRTDSVSGCVVCECNMNNDD